MDSPDTATRYSRQVRFPLIGPAGQERLGAARILLVGCGALGAGLAEMLVRSGVGTLVLVDRDVVDATNLGRQSTYTNEDVERRLPKAAALAHHLAAFNPLVKLVPCVTEFTPATAPELLADVELVLDGTDNLETRYLINDLCVRAAMPWIYGACVGSSGMTANIVPGETPCLRCLFPDPPPPGTLETCETAGIIAPAAMLVASVQAAEALKFLTGARAAVRRSLLRFELWPWRCFELGAAAAPRADCPCCAERKFPFAEAAASSRTAVLCGRHSVQLRPASPLRVELGVLAERLARFHQVKQNDWVLHFEAEGVHFTLFEDGRALLTGVNDPVAARTLFDRIIGT